MTRHPHREPHDAPSFHLGFALLIALTGALVVLAVSVDPWLLVMMGGVGVTLFAIYDSTDPNWYAL